MHGQKRVALLPSLMTLLVCLSSCGKRDHDGSSASSRDVGGQGGLDRCVIGNWQSTQAQLIRDELLASGGADVAMKIDAAGLVTLDFSKMAEMYSATKRVNYSFHYSGTATTHLKTPSAGVMTAADSNFSALRVTALVKMPGGGTISLFNNTPVATMIPKTGPLGATVAAPPQAASGTQGIDPTPVLSVDAYTCTPNTLMLSSASAHTQWTFSRSGA